MRYTHMQAATHSAALPPNSRVHLPLEPHLERNRIVVLFIASRIEQCNRTEALESAQFLDRHLRRFLPQLRCVSRPERAPLRGLGVKTFAQSIAWRDVFEPEIDSCFFPGNPTRP